jgi:hypothetical protein
VRLLDLPQARHFCAPPANVVAGINDQSLAAFHGVRSSVPLLTEGTPRFEIHQACLLRSVCRWLVYSLGHYRRSVDMLVPVSAPWMHVTLYYASFFAANAILGMFGGWIGYTESGPRVVDVERGAAGSQVLRIHRKLASPSGAKGSHRAFWDFFYDGVAGISAWAPVELVGALRPVLGDFGWQIAERNGVNYDMFRAWESSILLCNTFRASRLRTLSGPLKLQYEVAEQMLRLALFFGSEVSLSAEALVGCGHPGTRRQVQRRLASQAPPRIVTQSKFSEMLEV